MAQPIPENYRRVTPYLIVDGAANLMACRHHSAAYVDARWRVPYIRANIQRIGPAPG